MSAAALRLPSRASRLALLLAASFSASSASACLMHALSWTSELSLVSSTSSFRFAAADATSSSAPITAWKQNVYGLHGTSADATINGYVSSTLADVQQVNFDSTYAYVKITDIPSHAVGPFAGNPSYPAAQNRTVRIPRTPSVAATKTTTGMGPIGVMVNGVYFFNAADARTYNNAGTWQQNANVFEASGFDSAKGHPAPGMMGGGTGGALIAGTYHYHQSPQTLIEQLDPGNTGQHHSPLIGFAFDGFPIYGAYGYSDPTNPSSGIKQLTSGYKIRDDVMAGSRNTLVDGGTVLAMAQRGPAVSETYPAGAYLQDYEWVSGLGGLNQYNMRFAVTPEYPEGTWAYYVGASTTGNAVAYPYIIGPQYYGVVDTGAANATLPAGTTLLKVGDTNASGAVDFDDLLALAKHYNKSGNTLWSDGDLDRNGSVNFNDLLLLAKNYGGTSTGATIATDGSFAAEWALAQSLVPEPTAAALGLMALTLVRRR